MKAGANFLVFFLGSHLLSQVPALQINLCEQVRSIAGGSTTRNLPLDGVDIWAAITGGPAVPSPRTELLINLNAACHMGFVYPNAGFRVGEMKILVDCFNYTTMGPTGLVELYNLTADP